MKPKLPFLSTIILCVGLLLYGLKRYNGWDLETYFDAAEVACSGEHIYGGGKTLMLYPPLGGYFLELLRFLPKKSVHFGWYLISVLLFIRIVFIGLKFFPSRENSKKKQLLYLWLSIWAILQGIGAQLESGNINLFLMYFLFEGFSLAQKSQLKLFWGIFFLWIPVIFKPYLGLISLGLTVSMQKREGLRVYQAPIVLLVSSVIFAILAKGVSWFVIDLSNWLSSDVEHIHQAFTLSFNAVNFGLPSYLYHIYGCSLQMVTGVTLGTSLLALIYSFRESNQLKLFCVLSTLTFCISPASFSYSMLLLWFPILYFARELVFNRSSNLKNWEKLIGALFLIALIFLNPTFTGRAFFNGLIVPHRVTTWFVILGLGALWRRERDSNSR